MDTNTMGNDESNILANDPKETTAIAHFDDQAQRLAPPVIPLERIEYGEAPDTKQRILGVQANTVLSPKHPVLTIGIVALAFSIMATTMISHYKSMQSEQPDLPEQPGFVEQRQLPATETKHLELTTSITNDRSRIGAIRKRYYKNNDKKNKEHEINKNRNENDRHKSQKPNGDKNANSGTSDTGNKNDNANSNSSSNQENSAMKPAPTPVP